jgi:hypothetical protein
MPLTRSGRGTPVIVFDPLYGVRMTREYSLLGTHHKIFEDWRWRIVKNAVTPDYDGERRLFFVALSRAKQYITMTCRERRESSFITGVRGEPISDVGPRPRVAGTGVGGEHGERPAVSAYERRMKRISLHEVMREYDESGEGKGTEHGIRVHKGAQRIMSGMAVADESDEMRYIRKIYDSVKGARIRTETDCTVPVKDVVIAGRIDMLAEFDDRVEVHDYKTDMNRKNENRYIIQMSVYALAAESLGSKPVKCIIDYVSQGMSVTVEPVGKDEIYEKIRSAATDG